MLFDAIIVNDDYSYDYVKTDSNGIYGINISSDGIQPSDNNYLYNVFKKLFYNDSCRFLGYYKDYKIYYDDINCIKHFLKDDKEDLKLLFEFNGEDAFLYDDNFRKINKNEFSVKRFFIGSILVLVASINSFNLYTLTEPTPDTYDANKNPYYFHSMFQIYNFDSMDYKAAFDLINHSKLDSEDKIYLSDENLLKDVFKYYKGTALEYTANIKFRDMEIISFDESLSKFKPLPIDTSNLSGCYCSLYPNCIFVKDTNKNDTYYRVIAHEFVHLLQAEGLPYNYLVEASAELVASEYYDFEVVSYSKAVSNLELLIDIVGPEPIWKLIFGGDSKDFCDIIRNNLDSDDSEALLSALCASAKVTSDNNSSIHDEIKELLCRLYKSMYHKDIKDDPDIMYDLMYSSGYPRKSKTNFNYLNYRGMENTGCFEVDGVDALLENSKYLEKTGVCYCRKRINLGIFDELSEEEAKNVIIKSNYKDDIFSYGEWDNNKKMFYLFDNGPILSTEYTDSEFLSIPGKYIDIFYAFYDGYVSIYLYDYIARDKVPERWEIIRDTYSSKDERIVYNNDTNSVTFFKRGFAERFPEQYQRMIDNQVIDKSII